AMDDGDGMVRLCVLARMAEEIVPGFDDRAAVEIRVVIEDRIQSAANFENRARLVLRERVEDFALAIAGLSLFEGKRGVVLLIDVEVSHDVRRGRQRTVSATRRIRGPA